MKKKRMALSVFTSSFRLHPTSFLNSFRLHPSSLPNYPTEEVYDTRHEFDLD